MNVAVVGPGALGILFASRLSRAGISTTLVDHREARAKLLERNGLIVEDAKDTWRASPSIAMEIPKDQDFILIATKAYSTQALNFPKDVTLLSLQNGLGNIESLSQRVGSENVLGGTTSEACTLLDTGHVRHVSAGVSRFGPWTTCDEKPAQSSLEQAGFRLEPTNSPGMVIWEKAVLNSAINPLTALLGVPNGALLESADTRQLLRDLVVEGAKVAAAEDYRYPYSLVERAEELCQETAQNISSMLQDVRAGRPTEIEFLSGEIARRAETHSIQVPRTRVIYQLIKGLNTP